MPIEIKELNIKISLGGNDAAGTAPAQTGNGNDTPLAQQHKLVDVVVEKVLEILKTRTER